MLSGRQKDRLLNRQVHSGVVLRLFLRQLHPGDPRRLLQRLRLVDLVECFKEGEDVAGSGTLETFIVAVLNGETRMSLTKRALFQMVPLHLQPRVLGDHAQEVQTFFYALIVVGQIILSSASIFGSTFSDNCIFGMCSTSNWLFYKPAGSH